MNRERWQSLMESDAPLLTKKECAEGWHFCVEWDGLLVGPGMKESEFCRQSCPKVKAVPKKIRAITRAPYGKRGLYPRGGKLHKISCLLQTGISNREVARQTGASTITIAKVRAELEKLTGPILCPCGTHSIHQGWCSWRFKQSPKRQAVMKRLHAKKS